MARSASSEITITDINDGTNPVTAFMSNPSHVFAAAPGGVVSGVADFSSTLNVFTGSTQATYDATLSAINTFRITAVAYEGTPLGWTTPAQSDATITIPSIAQTHVDAAQITVTYDVRGPLTSVTGLTVGISLSIVESGTGGIIIESIPSRQTFTAMPNGTIDTGQDAIEVFLESQGTLGTISYAVSQNGGAFVARTATGTGIGQIAGYDTDMADAFLTGTLPTGALPARLQITGDNLGSNDSMSIRIQSGAGGLDTVTIFKVRQGETGEDSIAVVITSSDGVVFKNSAGTAKVLTATVIDAGTGTTPAGTITYTWTRAAGAAVMVTSATDRSVVATGGVAATGTEFSTITVGPEDVDEQERFGVSVEVT